jgi:hypothetical protein
MIVITRCIRKTTNEKGRLRGAQPALRGIRVKVNKLYTGSINRKYEQVVMIL